MAACSKFFRRFATVLKLLFLLAFLPLAVAELWTALLANGHCHDSAADCPQDSVGLVLGCSMRLGKGRPNFYFTGRMDAAEQLWKSGRVQSLIVSGDNSSRYYNEPKDMKEALVKRGVPADRITCDFGGLRTYDSVYRAHHIFGADSLTIVSQDAHAQRAVAIARHLGIKAEGLNAPLTKITHPSRLRQFLRERCARIAMVYDFLIDRKPTHMGNKEQLPR